jgi:hypothetical protein
MTRRRQLQRFGRMAVGQRIRFERNCVLPPTTDPKGYMRAFFDWEAELVQLVAKGRIVRIEQGYFDAFVTMRFDDGREVTRTLDADGMEPGGWDRLRVVQEAPEQRSLISEAA